jgi:hypothetical protein
MSGLKPGPISEATSKDRSNSSDPCGDDSRKGRSGFRPVVSVELVRLRKNRQQQVQKQIPFGNDRQKGKDKNQQQQVPIRGSFASAAKSAASGSG